MQDLSEPSRNVSVQHRESRYGGLLRCSLAGVALTLTNAMFAASALADCGPLTQRASELPQPIMFTGSSVTEGSGDGVLDGPGNFRVNVTVKCPSGNITFEYSGTLGDGSAFNGTGSGTSSGDIVSIASSEFFVPAFEVFDLVEIAANVTLGSIVLAGGISGFDGESNLGGATIGFSARAPLDDGTEAGEQFNQTVDAISTGQVHTTTSTTGTNARAGATQGGTGGDTSSGFVPFAGGLRYVGGVNAGDGFAHPFGVWAAFDHTDFEDDTGGLGLDGDTNSLLVGADFSPWVGTAFGVSFGYEDSDVDTLFNGGDIQMDGFSVVPYMAFYLSDHVGVGFDLTSDISIGYSSLDLDLSRTVGGARVSGSTESDRFFFAGNLTAGQSFGDLYVSGSTGILVSRADIDSFTDSSGALIADQRSEFGQFRLGGEAAYAWGSFEPYADVSWLYAYDREKSIVVSDDVNSFDVGLGLRYYGDSFSSGIGYSTILGRDNVDEDTFSVQIRGDF